MMSFRLRAFLLSLMLAFIVGAVVTDAQASSQLLLVRCEPHDAWMNVVRQYGEVRVAAGVNERGIVEVFANRETGSFTVIVTDVHGVACGIAAGENFETLQQQGAPT